ncbi:MAG: hypothetical protein U0521_20965 [Anaerolineae bacterium]
MRGSAQIGAQGGEHRPHDARSALGVGWKPVSGMKAIRQPASSSDSAPAAMNDRLRCALASATLRMIPAIPATCLTCAARTNAAPARASPISSAIHASVAPLMKVAPMPATTSASRIAPNCGISPSTSSATPVNATPTITESRRLYTSATTPVGISNRKIVPSNAVPIRTICSASRPTVWA